QRRRARGGPCRACRPDPVRSLARIFPDQQTFAVGEPSAGPVPAHQCIGPATRTFLKERANIAMSPEYTALAVIEDGLDKGSLQHRFLGIKRQQAFGIERFRTVMPLLMNARAIAQEHTVRCRSVFIHDDETPAAMPAKQLSRGDVPMLRSRPNYQVR